MELLPWVWWLHFFGTQNTCSLADMHPVFCHCWSLMSYCSLPLVWMIVTRNICEPIVTCWQWSSVSYSRSLSLFRLHRSCRQAAGVLVWKQQCEAAAVWRGWINCQTHHHYCRQLTLLIGLFGSVLFLLWPPYVIGQAIIFCPVVSSSSIFFFSSPILSRRRLAVYHTSTHGVAVVRI